MDTIMKKYFLTAVALCMSMHVSAHDIITPDIATSMYRTNRFSYDKNKDIIICQSKYKYEIGANGYKCVDDNSKNAWTKLTDSVPEGKKYVGFKSVDSNGHHKIEIYWRDSDKAKN